MNSIKIYKKVRFLGQYEIGDFCIIGIPPKDKEYGKLKTTIGKNSIIRSHTVIYAGNKIGNDFQIGHGVLIRENNIIGNNVSIGSHSNIEHDIKIGDNVRIHSAVFIPEFSVLKKKCWIGPNVVFTNALHPLCPKVKQCLKGPKIEENVIIGANVTVLPHLKIGKNAFIGAGSVVTQDIPKNSVAIGNPAKVIKKISDIICTKGFIDKPYKC